MSIFFVRTTLVRRSAGQSAVACSAYRTGEKLDDKYYGVVRDYTRKKGVIASGIERPVGAPLWVDDREALYYSIESNEDTSTRRNEAQLLREFMIAIPHELRDKAVEITKEISSEVFAREGMIADWAVHEPSRNGDERNIHAHILTTLRRMKPDGTWQSKERKWNTKSFHKAIKEKICTVLNKWLERYGFKERLDSRSYIEQGINVLPTKHKGVRRTAMERNGKHICIDGELIDEWSFYVNRQSVFVDTALGYKMLANAAMGSKEHKLAVLEWFEKTENKWVRRMVDAVPNRDPSIVVQAESQARSYIRSNSIFADLNAGRIEAKKLMSIKENVVGISR